MKKKFNDKNLAISLAIIGLWMGGLSAIGHWLWPSWWIVALQVAGYLVLVVWTSNRWPIKKQPSDIARELEALIKPIGSGPGLGKIVDRPSRKR